MKTVQLEARENEIRLNLESFMGILHALTAGSTVYLTRLCVRHTTESTTPDFCDNDKAEKVVGLIQERLVASR